MKTYHGECEVSIIHRRCGSASAIVVVPAMESRDHPGPAAFGLGPDDMTMGYV